MLCKDFYDYIAYEDGKIYSHKTNKFLKFDFYGAYAKVTLSVDKKPVRYSVHRLVACLFCNPPENYRELDVDHLDSNHFNNAAYNLEYVTCAENNKRAGEKGFNNISLSNSERWQNKDFQNKTAKNISKGQIESGCFSEKNNPSYRFEIRNAENKEYMISELVNLTGKSLTWVYNHIIKFLAGENVKEFENCGIVSIKDLKSKVNRLSKA